MSNIKKLVCDNCGGHIDRDTLTCLCCGTQYEKQEEYPDVLRIVTTPARLETLRCNVYLPNELLYFDHRQAIEQAVNEITRKFSERLLPFIEFEMSEKFRTCETEIAARLTVEVPDHKVDGLIFEK